MHPIILLLTDLPDGAVVVVEGEAYTLRAGLAHRWTNEGYDRPEILHDAMALFAGYQPVFHPSISTTRNRPEDARPV